MIFGWGKKQKIWTLTNDKQLIAVWSYFHIFWFPMRVSAITWYIIGDSRSEDVAIPYEKVKELFPEKVPDIGFWNQYGLFFIFSPFLLCCFVSSILQWIFFLAK